MHYCLLDANELNSKQGLARTDKACCETLACCAVHMQRDMSLQVQQAVLNGNPIQCHHIILSCIHIHHHCMSSHVFTAYIYTSMINAAAVPLINAHLKCPTSLLLNTAKDGTETLI